VRRTSLHLLLHQRFHPAVLPLPMLALQLQRAQPRALRRKFNFLLPRTLATARCSLVHDAICLLRQRRHSVCG
jgi:hypothetical protein